MMDARPSPAGSGPLAPPIPAGLAGSLLLVRHAQSTWVAENRFQGRLDPPLSPLGEEQARRIAAWLAGPGRASLGLAGAPREIAHSPLARVARTAAEIAWAASAASAPAAPAARAAGGDGSAAAAALLRPEPGLLEVGVGEWSGLTIAEVDARWPREHAGWRRDPIATTPPGGERLLDADARVRAAIPGLLAALGPGPAATDAQPWSVVVAHGGILRLLLFALLGLPLDRFWAFPFALASVSVVTVAGGRGALTAHNLAEHLAGLEGDAGGLRAF